jgi:hypothetical protein
LFGEAPFRHKTFIIRKRLRSGDFVLTAENLQIAIKDAHGVPLLVQLLKTSENFEVSCFDCTDVIFQSPPYNYSPYSNITRSSIIIPTFALPAQLSVKLSYGA